MIWSLLLFSVERDELMNRRFFNSKSVGNIPNICVSLICRENRNAKRCYQPLSCWAKMWYMYSRFSERCREFPLHTISAHYCYHCRFRCKSGPIRTFGNRCLSTIGGGNRWSRFAGWVQLWAEAAWPPRSTASATLCAQATMRLMIMIYHAGNLHK